MQVLEDYNNQLRKLEAQVMSELNSALVASFNRLVRRVRAHINMGRRDQVQRNLALLQEFRQLIPTLAPDREDYYTSLFNRLLKQSSDKGLQSARTLTEYVRPNRIDVKLPLEATASALLSTRERLAKHGEDFAQRASQVVARGIAEGRPTGNMVQDLSNELDIVKSRSSTIVRTESLRAYNKAADYYYSQNNIQLVAWYATSDDRTCAFCTPRAGNVYRRGDVEAPLHPNCRCYLAPWSETVAEMDPDYVATIKRHKREVKLYTVVPPPSILNKAIIFNQSAPAPVLSP